MDNTELVSRLVALDWSQCSLQHQLAVAAAVSTLRGDAPKGVTCGWHKTGDWWTCDKCDTHSFDEFKRPCNAPASRAASMPIHSNVVALVPRDAPAPSMRHVTLLHLDGHVFASAGFLPGLASAPWSWIVETVAAELECSEDDVGSAEPSEDDGGGDLVTVDGIPCYRVAIGSKPPSAPMMTDDGPVGSSA